MSSEKQEDETSKYEVELRRPQLFFETITFSDSTTLTLDEDDIVVFVGPNNAGKSAALRELERWVARSETGLVIKNAKIIKNGTRDDLKAYLEAKAQKNGSVQASTTVESDTTSITRI